MASPDRRTTIGRIRNGNWNASTSVPTHSRCILFNNGSSVFRVIF